MCDTLVVPPRRTRERAVIFAKNSDREPNEAQYLLSLPAMRHAPGATVPCTYLPIAQVARTHAVLLSKPFWMWGAEMGVNEHGVAIGNEAVFTRVAPEPSPALLGMDLVRLGLERARDATEALEVITALLERHGQGGNGGYTRDFRYDNAFLIADPTGAWVLETAGRRWAAKQVEDAYAISNGLTITTSWDRASDDLVEQAREADAGGAGRFDFAAFYTDPARTSASACAARRARLGGAVGSSDAFTLEDAMRALRDHGHARPLWQGTPPAPASKTVCMHFAGAGNALSQTTGSLVAQLYPDGPMCLATGTAAPCTGVFKPVWPGIPVPGQSRPPGASFDADTLFWRHERLHRRAVFAGESAASAYRPQADALERRFLELAEARRTADADTRAALVEACFGEADAASEGWLRGLVDDPEVRRRGGAVPRAEASADAYADGWRALNRAARMPDPWP